MYSTSHLQNYSSIMPPMWHAGTEHSNESLTEADFGATMFFIPQLPYVFKGTLVENLVYPFFSLFDDERPALGRYQHSNHRRGSWHSDHRFSLNQVETDQIEADAENQHRPSNETLNLLHHRRSTPLSRKTSSWARCCSCLRREFMPDSADEVVLQADTIEPHQISSVMDMAGLKSIYERYAQREELHTSRDWDSILSPGEKQRLNFARLFLRLHYHSTETVNDPYFILKL